MRLMERNKRQFFYSLYQSQLIDRDEYGNETGEPTKVYSHPVAMRASVSAASGYAQSEQFGTLVQYDKVIITDDMNCPIDENTILFVDKEPSFDSDNNPIPDYIVKRVAKSLNTISYAISRVNVS